MFVKSGASKWNTVWTFLSSGEFFDRLQIHNIIKTLVKWFFFTIGDIYSNMTIFNLIRLICKCVKSDWNLTFYDRKELPGYLNVLELLLINSQQQPEIKTPNKVTMRYLLSWCHLFPFPCLLWPSVDTSMDFPNSLSTLMFLLASFLQQHTPCCWFTLGCHGEWSDKQTDKRTDRKAAMGVNPRGLFAAGSRRSQKGSWRIIVWKYIR